MDNVMKAEIEKVFMNWSGAEQIDTVRATKEITALIIKWLEGKKQTGGNGDGCKCGAHYYGECCCINVDWTDIDERNQLITELIGEVR